MKPGDHLKASYTLYWVLNKEPQLLNLISGLKELVKTYLPERINIEDFLLIREKIRTIDLEMQHMVYFANIATNTPIQKIRKNFKRLNERLNERLERLKVILKDNPLLFFYANPFHF